MRAHSLPRGGLITTNLADIVQRAREMVSKETQIFLSWFWLRWEPGLVRKSEVLLSATGPPFPVEPPAHPCLLLLQLYTPDLAYTSISVHNSCFPPCFCLFFQSLFISAFVCTDLNIWESLQTVQKLPLMATIHMEPTMFQKVHRSHFYYFHLHSNPVIERILSVHQMNFLLFPGTTFPSLPCH